EQQQFDDRSAAIGSYVDRGAIPGGDAFARAREYRSVDDSLEPGVAAQHQQVVGDCNASMSESDAAALERELAGDVEMIQ
ncbi:hypothetical protein GGI08_008947, partial [Coemansia sp. S2]